MQKFSLDEPVRFPKNARAIKKVYSLTYILVNVCLYLKTPFTRSTTQNAATEPSP
jgi:hypothetical protein